MSRFYIKDEVFNKTLVKAIIGFIVVLIIAFLLSRV